MFYRESSSSFDQRALLTGVALSLVLHVAFFIVLNRPPLPLPQPVVFTVSIEPPTPKKLQQPPKEQMVTPPQTTPSEVAPENTANLSDENFIVPKEQLHRGDLPNAGTPGGAPSRESKPSERSAGGSKGGAPRERAAEKPVPEIKQLALDDATLLEKFSARAPKPALDDEIRGNNSAAPHRGAGSYQAFNRPAGSGAAFLGSAGTSDFLPNLPDGDITLLNAKANRFAVFVRRVATNVFTELRTAGWGQLSPNDINAIADFSIVRATLSPEGKLLEVKLSSASGSSRFDKVLNEAVQQGARDPNPPKEAATSDGNIHFIFEARSWSMPANNVHNGGVFERRWLLLATGLE